MWGARWRPALPFAADRGEGACAAERPGPPGGCRRVEEPPIRSKTRRNAPQLDTREQGQGRRSRGGTWFGKMNQLLAAGGDELTRAAHGADVVLLQNGSGLLQTMLQGLGGFKVEVTGGPAVLPMEGQGAQPQHGKAQAKEGAAGDAMEAGQPGRLSLHRPGGEGSLQKAQSPLPGLATSLGTFRTSGSRA